MASTSAVMAALPITTPTQKKPFNPTKRSIKVRASMREKSVTMREKAVVMREKAMVAGLAAAVAAAMVVPEAAEAAAGVPPSLKNFLLSIGAGGVVLVAIIGAVIGVSNFDPVKRG